MEIEIWEAKCVVRRKGEESGEIEKIQIIAELDSVSAMQRMPDEDEYWPIGGTLIRREMLG